jgi:hypothetical protein
MKYESAIAQKEGYKLRFYKSSDETQIVNLFNEIYKRFAGFVPRTTEFWNWCCRDRPNVTPEGIPIVEYKSKIIGYAVVATSGEVLEFCCDSIYDSKMIAQMLLEYITEYVGKTNGKSVTLNAPIDDQVLRQVCKNCGFTEMPVRSVLIINMIDIVGFIQEIASHLERHQVEQSVWNEVYLFKLTNAPSWCPPKITIMAKETISVVPKEADKPTVYIETDVPIVVSCIFGVMEPFKAVLSSTLRVQPLWKIPKVLGLFSSLRLKDSWYIPRADRG